MLDQVQHDGFETFYEFIKVADFASNLKPQTCPHAFPAAHCLLLSVFCLLSLCYPQNPHPLVTKKFQQFSPGSLLDIDNK